jgi:phosphonate transport system substrate-binding protein
VRTIPQLTALVAVAMLAVSGCGGTKTTKTSADAGGGTSAAACPGGKVRFGIEPYEDPAKLKPAYEVLAGALQAKLGCPVELQIVQDYAAEVLAMQNGKLELAEFGPLGYVFAHQKANAEPLASFADGTGKLTTYTAGIWVAKDSPIQTINDLKGKSLALSETGSTSGDALPRYALKKAGIEQSAVKISYAGGHPQSLLALTHGKVDAAEINSQELATAKTAGQFDEAKYRKIWASDPIPNDPIAVNGKLDSAFKTKVATALTGLAASDVAKVGAFLDVNPPGPLINVTNDTYQPLFDLASALGLTEKDV